MSEQVIPMEAVESYAPFDAHTYQLSNGILTFRDSNGEDIGTMTMAEFARWRDEARREWKDGGMTTRRININTPVLPDPQIFGWIQANGIDPGTVLAAQEVTVKDGQLTYMEFVRDESGAKVLSSDKTGFVKRERTVPLISPPEDHGL